MAFKITAEEKAWILRQRKIEAKDYSTDYGMHEVYRQKIGKSGEKYGYTDLSYKGTYPANAVFLYNKRAETRPEDDIKKILFDALNFPLTKKLKFKPTSRANYAEFAYSNIPFFVEMRKELGGANSIVIYVNFSGDRQVFT